MFAGRHVVHELAPHRRVQIADRAAFGLDFFRNELAEDAEGGVHDVAAHVAERTGTELPPAAPVEGMRAGAALVFLGRGFVEVELEVRLARFAREPQIPVQVRRAFDELLFDRSLRPDGPIGPKTDFLERANGTLFDPLLRHALTVHRAALVAHLRDNFRFFRGAMQVTHLGDVIAERLLHADVLAVLDGMHRGEVMRVVGSRDDDAVDVLGHLIEHLAEVLIELRRRRRSLTGVEMVLLTLLRGFLKTLRVHIDHRDDVVVQRDHARVGQAFAVRTDLGQIQPLARCVLTAQKEIRAGESTRRESGGSGEETTT